MAKLTNKAQTNVSEYLVTFFIAIGSIVAMTVYVQRALQAKIRDSRNYMIETAAQAQGHDIQFEYEPYYGFVNSMVSRESDVQQALLPGGTTGFYTKNMDESIYVESLSVQAPPREAK
jgi:hypothetical protein